jgi:serine/threonine protein kinase/tetratricopeptide (TPR) repeat protein
MDTPRWERLQELFHHAVTLPERERVTYLALECGDDSALMDEVLAMVEEDARDSSLLDRDLAHVAHQVLEPATRTLPATNFGPYRVKSILGEGGMGVVYLAERRDLGSLAAIKILRDASLSPARRERFASEQRTLAQLSHDSIARLYDADTLPDGTPWFVMEYVEGVPLTQYCEVRILSIAERLRLFRAVCEAVQHAHQHAVIHRDLKPSNILVKDDGTVKLLDFGIAKQLETLDIAEDHTRTGMRLMTPAYAAPEQIRAGRVGIHTDIYSLGVILYELLSGRLPYDISKLTPGEAEAIITGQEPVRPSIVARRLADSVGGSARVPALGDASWADLDVLCLTAMHKEPQRRYQTVEALIRDVDHYLDGEPLEARPDSIAYRAGKFVRRHRGAVTGTSLAVALLAALAVFYTIRLTSARNAAVAEAARTQRVMRFMLALFAGGDATAGPSDTLRVVTLIDRGEMEARSLDGEPALQAELYETLGSINQKLGNLDRADSLLARSLQRRRALFGTDHPDIASSLVALGLLRVDQAKYDEAEQLVSEGLGMDRRILPATHPSIAHAAWALGKVYEERGEYDKAVPLLQEAVAAQSASGEDTAALATSLSELANVHYYMGHLATSDSLNQRVLVMNRQLHGSHHPTVADALINLGASQSDRGNFAEAERYYREALAINEPWYGMYHPETASDLTMLGRALVAEKKLPEAVPLLEQALAINERVYGRVHPSVASTLNELAKVALLQNRYDEAEASFRRMSDIYRSVYGEKHYLNGIALSNLGSVYLEKKEYARAEQLFRQVIGVFTRALSATHLNTGVARVKLGRALVLQHRYAEAEKESLAGYDILKGQINPQMLWMMRARRDLVEEYDSLRQPTQAARFRAELADGARMAESARAATPR